MASFTSETRFCQSPRRKKSFSEGLEVLREVIITLQEVKTFTYAQLGEEVEIVHSKKSVQSLFC